MIKESLLLGSLFFFLLIGTAQAVDISSCYNITSSGYYRLTTDIVTPSLPSGQSCIWINASNVVLDMNGKTIWGCGGIGIYGSCGYGFGIAVYPLAPPELTNIEIKNGAIVGFGGSNIYIGNVHNITVKYVNTITGDRGFWVSPARNLTIKYTNITLAKRGLDFGGVVYSNFEKLFIRTSEYALYGSGVDYSNFTDLNIYNQMINTTITPECFSTGVTTTCIYPVFANGTYVLIKNDGAGLYCNWCERSIFAGMLIGTVENAVEFVGNSRYNTIGNSILYTPYGKGLYLSPATNNNYICGIIGNIFNYGTGNTIETICPSWIAPFPFILPCVQGYTCIDNNSAYVDIFCNMINITDCPYGCDTATGKCRPLPPTQPINITPVIPPEMFPPETRFLTFFLSPIFLISAVALGIGAIVEYYVRTGGIAFTITSILILFILTISGYFPVWLLILFIVVAGIVLAYLGRKLIKGD